MNVWIEKNSKVLLTVVLLLTAILAVSFYQFVEISVPGALYNESNLNPKQAKLQSQFLESKIIPLVYKSPEGSIRYCTPGNDYCPTVRPEWLTETGEVVPTGSEKTQIAFWATVGAPNWASWLVKEIPLFYFSHLSICLLSGLFCGLVASFSVSRQKSLPTSLLTVPGLGLVIAFALGTYFYSLEVTGLGVAIGLGFGISFITAAVLSATLAHLVIVNWQQILGVNPQTT